MAKTDEQARFAAVKSQTDLFVATSDVAYPVTAVFSSHSADHRAGHSMEFALLSQSVLKRLLDEFNLFIVHVAALCHLEVIEIDLAG